MPEDPFESHEKEIKKSLVLALFARENMKGYKPEMQLVFQEATKLYGSSKELQDARNIPLSYIEIESIANQLVNEKLMGSEFVYPSSELYLPISMKVYWLKGFASPELKVVYWSNIFNERKILEETQLRKKI